MDLTFLGVFDSLAIYLLFLFSFYYFYPVNFCLVDRRCKNDCLYTSENNKFSAEFPANKPNYLCLFNVSPLEKAYPGRNTICVHGQVLA